uniref:Uncharacterized protein n=1 Tax=Varanus komodoensis TaxID=61221 RepID=A0A8D2IR75_VARKO
MDLPLEALNIFQEEAISSVSRDFSLQVLYNRLHKEEAGISILGCFISLLNNTMLLMCKIIMYSELENPAQKFKTVLEKYEPFTHRWDGVIGDTQFPSQVEWEHLLNNCSAFVFSGMERFLSYILLDRLAAMNIPECQLMILSELVHSKPSIIRVRNLDEDRSSFRLSLEMPTETAIILSLIGVHSIIVNQWYTTLEDNTRNLERATITLPSHLGDLSCRVRGLVLVSLAGSSVEATLRVELTELLKGKDFRKQIQVWIQHSLHEQRIIFHLTRGLLELLCCEAMKCQ